MPKLKITVSDMARYRDQSLADQLAWHKANSKPSDKSLSDYSAGFQQGWLLALQALQVHADVQLTDSRKDRS